MAKDLKSSELLTAAGQLMESLTAAFPGRKSGTEFYDWITIESRSLTSVFSEASGVKLEAGADLKYLVEQALAQGDFASTPLTGAAREDYLKRRYDLLAEAMREDPDFSDKAIAPGETYLEVDQKGFSVSDEAGQYQWLGTRGVGPCGALVLYAEKTDSAPATASLAHLDAQTDIDPSLTSMLSRFGKSQTVKAVLVGANTELNLAGDVIEFLQKKNIPVKAHIGVHSSVAVHVASGSIIASPSLPMPSDEDIKMMASRGMAEGYAAALTPNGKVPVKLGQDDRGGGKSVSGKWDVRNWHS